VLSASFRHCSAQGAVEVIVNTFMKCESLKGQNSRRRRKREYVDSASVAEG
jgi:hypothetical protein